MRENLIFLLKNEEKKTVEELQEKYSGCVQENFPLELFSGDIKKKYFDF